MFAFHDVLGPVGAAFTDRAGGVSTGPFASLNLAVRTDDDPAAVAENRRRAVAALTGSPQTPVALMRQVHGDTVVTVSGPTTEPPEADALVTAERGLVLVVQVADCVPVLLADPASGLVGAAHAGRNGLALGVVPRAVERLHELGAGRLTAWVGPHVCGGCYEVPAALRDEVAERVPSSYADTTWGTPSIDVGRGVRTQLAEAGVDDVRLVERCTREDPDLYSYRRDGALSGRLAGLVWVQP
ncbi:peptidoglycan editing factor PgeF [Nocardioides marmoribigeumensis]|uniref:Purine nucleoside phosphorylase n=1 Tax=Nocardioides marmoribigeumensis TaxID=433649 RepID=A0ABU2BRJ7_9ACTN|nr:peptidoglycan editing factor PgeF [Nocardioides marmoribigeumensis]MDR7361277.1 YfiH family protein [Nocardioides marmoribigeumensis]